jgi:hypothetical protein
MKLVSAKCPSCNASIETDPTKEAGVCKYCNTAFITEKAINHTNYSIGRDNITQNFLGATPIIVDHKQPKPKLTLIEKAQRDAEKIAEKVNRDPDLKKAILFRQLKIIIPIATAILSIIVFPLSLLFANWQMIESGWGWGPTIFLIVLLALTAISGTIATIFMIKQHRMYSLKIHSKTTTE